MDEVWRAVPGYEGLYEVSDQGRVRSLDRITKGPAGTRERHNGRILTPTPTKTGHYLDVSLKREDQPRKHRTVHSLVAEVFLGPRPKGYDVMHLNGDRTDNRACNLRYGTRKENLNQTYEYGGTQARGKLTKADVIDVRRRLRRGDSPIDIAKEYGVDNAAIYHIRNGTTFKWLKDEEEVC